MHRAWLCIPLVIACTAGSSETDPVGTDMPVAPDRVVVRVVTWNIEGLGRASDPEGQAERAVLARIDADIVGLNEVSDEQAALLRALGDDLGYETVFLPVGNPFGSLRNAVLTRLPVVNLDAPSAGELSGDGAANDVTRWPVRLTVDAPDAEQDLTVVVNHWKSGFDLTDRFRRTLDGVRTAQAAAEAPGPVLVMGDVNAQLDEMPESPPTWTYTPGGLPRDYRVGADQRDALDVGLPNSAFAPLTDLGLSAIDATQLDGRPDTRPQSGRRIDWVFASLDRVEGVAGEVYDSTDEGQGSGLPKSGDAPDRGASGAASDHLPIFVDVALARSP